MAEMGTQNTAETLEGEDSADAITAEWDRQGDNTPVFAIVSAIADATGADPIELPPLAKTIDPEALNDLFTSRPDAGVDELVFQYADYTVEVRGDATIRIRPDQG